MVRLPPLSTACQVSLLFLAGVMPQFLGCTTASRQADSAARAGIRREEVISLAEAYRQHRWLPTAANIRHGRDAQGIQVDTPDTTFHAGDGLHPDRWTPGRYQVGVPYQWGGFDTLAAFDQKTRAGLAAGDAYTAAKRAGLDSAVSQEATGIDCSGLISRCWRLDRSFSTRELPSLCQRLASYDDLRPGDILNTHNAHVLLFAGWRDAARSRMVIYEAGCHPTWRVVRRMIPRQAVQAKGYLPFRYRGIRD